MGRHQSRPWFLFASFFLPFLLMWGIYIARQVFPFGEESVLVLDMNAQYIAYFEAFRDAFFEGKSLLYSWSRSLGGEMLGLTAYYLASPFTFVTLLFPSAYMTEALLFLTLLKVGAAGLTFSIFLRSSRKVEASTCVFLSCLYALSSYMLVQVMNIMWIDGVIFLPLILLGVENLRKGRGFFLFTISLTVMFLANYYIGYMIGIFSFLYFLWFYFSTTHVGAAHGSKRAGGSFVLAFGKQFLSFMGCAVLAVLCSSFVILPVYYSLQQGKFDFSTPDFTPKSQFPIFDLLAKFLMSSYDTVRPEGLPLVYCGMAALLLLPLYFFNWRIKLKPKLLSAGVLAALILSFHISTLDLVWHGFQKPNWLPYRYSFAFIFFVLLLAGETLRNLQGIRLGTILKVYGTLTVMIVVLDKMEYSFLETEKAICLSLLFLSASAGILCLMVYLLKEGKRGKVRVLTLLLTAVSLGELFLNGQQTLEALDKDVLYSTRPSYRDFVDRTLPAVQAIQERDPGFYRIEKTYFRTVNDPMSMGFYGVSHSSSSLNAKIIQMIENLGFATKSHWTKYEGGTELTTSLLGIKYLMSEEPLDWDYPQIDQVEDIFIYENPSALPVIFAASIQADYASQDASNPFVYQNELLSALAGERYTEYFQPVPFTGPEFENSHEGSFKDSLGYLTDNKDADSYLEYTLQPQNDRVVYCFFPSKYKYAVNLWLDGKFVDTYFENTTYRIVELGKLDPEGENKLRMTLKKHEVYFERPLFYSLDAQAVHAAMNKIAASSLEVTKHSESKLTATVRLEEGQMLFTTIPYETGWRLKVDGKPVKTTMSWNALLTARVEPGVHTIELRFLPKEWVWGCLLSGVGMALVIGLLLLKRYFLRHPTSSALSCPSPVSKAEEAYEGPMLLDFSVPEEQEQKEAEEGPKPEPEPEQKDPPMQE